MKVSIGEKGLTKTWQKEFPKETSCVYCNGESRIGFVSHEGLDEEDSSIDSVSSLHENTGKGGYWLHDYCCVAVYFCKDCLRTTALWNQG